MGGRGPASTVLAALAAVLLGAALVAWYADHNLFDSDRFADRATSTLDDDAVKEEIATRVTDDVVIRKERDLTGARPLIEGAAQGIVGSTAFQGLFHSAVRDAHRTIFKRDSDTVVLKIADIGTVVSGALETVNPKLAKKVGAEKSAELLESEPPAVVRELAQVGEDVQLLSIVLLVAAIAAIVAAMVLSPDRRRTAAHAGVAVAIVGALLLVAYQIGRSVVLGKVEDPDASAAAADVWDAFALDLRTTLLLFTGAGAVIAAAASSVWRPVEVGAQIKRAWRVAVTVPETPWRRALRAVLLLVAGLLVVLNRDAALQLAVLAVGVYIFYKGVEELLSMIVRGEPGAAVAGARERGVTFAAPRRIAVVAAIAAVIIVAAGGLFVGLGGTSEEEPSVPTSGCNGHEELCDKPLNEVSFAAAHNAMSGAAYPGYLFANHERTIAQQLDAGVHALLIDSHYGIKISPSKVKTDLGDISNVERQEYVKEIGEPAVDAALRIRDSAGFKGSGPRGIYLCHRFCELGFVPLAKALGDVRDYLVSHPNDVLVIVNEDYVDPADVMKAVSDAKLDEFLFRGPPGPPWPTLRELIDSNQRLILMAENDAGGLSGYFQAYELTQETPYRFKRLSELLEPKQLARSCRPNRGPPDASLFLLNHWIDTGPAAKPSSAEKVNAYRALLRRARECRRRRGLLPNLVAVDFSATGDLLEVVDTLNELKRGE